VTAVGVAEIQHSEACTVPTNCPTQSAAVLHGMPQEAWHPVAALKASEAHAAGRRTGTILVPLVVIDVPLRCSVEGKDVTDAVGVSEPPEVSRRCKPKPGPTPASPIQPTNFV
jgi:hypothetical protein